MQNNFSSYAITTVDFSTLNTETVNKSTQKPKKQRINKEPINKMFLDYADTIDDPFWVAKLRNIATGKLMSKFSYKDGVLYYKKSNKNTSVVLPSTNYEAAITCIDFFKSNAGIFSPLDKEKIRLEDSIIIDVQDVTWSKATKKIKECLISYYIQNIKEVMDLTDKQMEQLRKIINLGLITKVVNSTNINIEQNRIVSILPILFNDETSEFYLDPRIKPPVSRTIVRKRISDDVNENGESIPRFSKLWLRYIESLKLIMDKYHNKQTNSNENNTTNITTDVYTTDADEELTQY